MAHFPMMTAIEKRGRLMGTVTRVAENGRLSLPSQLRRQVGLDRGGPVSVWVEDGEIRIRAVRAVMEDLRAEAFALFDGSGESVDRLIADRRVESLAETEERG